MQRHSCTEVGRGGGEKIKNKIEFNKCQSAFYIFNYEGNVLTEHLEVVCVLDVHGSVHRNINRIEITNKMQPCSRIHY
jgi:hypothetical protein